MLAAGPGCYTAYISEGANQNAEPPTQSIQSDINLDRPVRVVVLVPAQPAVITGENPEDPRIDWFPVELAVGDPRFAIFFRDLDSIRRNPQEQGGENRAALLDTLPNRLTQTWGPGKHPHIEYRRYLNLAEYRADAATADPRGSGRLLIRLYGMESRANSAALLSCLTAMVVPFYSDEAVFAETFFLSLDDQVQNLSEDRSPEDWPKLRTWFGWLFFVWGPINSTDDEAIIPATVDAHIRAAARAGIFVPASSRINL